jgi:hypothetical protein
VAAHRRPGDVVLVSVAASFGFAYYWHLDRPRIQRGGRMATGWYVDYPPADRIVVNAGGTPEDIAAGFQAARSLVGGGTLWIVRSHIMYEGPGWDTVLAGQPATTVPVGSEPLLLRLGGASPS